MSLTAAPYLDRRVRTGYRPIPTWVITSLCAVLAGATFAAVTNQPSVRALGAVVLAASAAVVAAASRSAVGALVGLAWSVVAVGAAVQIRLSPTAATRTFVVVVVGALVVPVLASLCRAVLARRSGLGLTRPAARGPVGLLTLTLILRVVPAFVGHLAGGTLPLPLVGSVQVGEYTRPLFVLAVAWLLDVLLRRAVRFGWDGHARVAAGVGLGLAAAYLALLVVFDTGPAVLSVIAVVVVAVLQMPRARVVLRRARGVVPSSALARVALGLLLSAVVVGWMLVRLGAVERWTRRLDGVSTPQQQVVLAVTAAQRGGLIGSGLGSQPLVGHIPVAGSDMLVATAGAELGLGLVAVLVAGVLVMLGTLTSAVLRASRAVAPPTVAVAPAVAVALLVSVQAQLIFSVLGSLGLAPMTGITPPLLGVGGSSLIPVAAVIGFALGSLGQMVVPEQVALPPVPRAAQAVGAVAVAACLVLTVAAPIGGGHSLATLMLPRGAILTRDGQVIAAATSPTSKGRDYPAGSLYTDLGVLVPNYRATGVESTFGVDLTCGAASSFWARLASPVHPIPCRPATVVTTIDSTVQQGLARVLTGMSGSAVVMDSTSGEVLGLYSTDQPDANQVQPGQQTSSTARLSQLTPGSAFKPLVATVALADGLSSAHAPADVLALGGEQLRNEYNLTCPDTSLQGAIAYSCNTVFGDLAVRLGAHRLRSGLQQLFGVDQPFIFDGGDATGLSIALQDDATAGQVARTGIGQESVSTSPLALTWAIGAIARAAGGGSGPAPAAHILAAVCSEGTTRRSGGGASQGSALDQGNAKAVMAGMSLAVKQGTLRDVGTAALTAGRDVAGKTGTADVSTSQSPSRILRWATVVVDHRWVVTVVVRGQQAGDVNGAGTAVAALLASLPTAPSVVRCSAS